MEIVYPTVIGAARLLFRALDLRITVEGDAHVPAHGPVVLAANHVSFLDFTLVGLAARRARRRVRFLARHDVWHHPVARPLMNAMRHVPVDRAAPAAAFLRARSLLERGEAVGVFPEAGVSTSYTVRSLMPGAAALAAATGAPLVPVAIWGPQRILTAHQGPDLTRGRPVSLVVGEPVAVHRDPVRTTHELGVTLQDLLDELQGRDRHRPPPGQAAPWHPAHLGGGAPTPEQARAAEELPSTALPPLWTPGRARTSWPAPVSGRGRP